MNLLKIDLVIWMVKLLSSEALHELLNCFHYLDSCVFLWIRNILTGNLWCNQHWIKWERDMKGCKSSLVWKPMRKYWWWRQLACCCLSTSIALLATIQLMATISTILGFRIGFVWCKKCMLIIYLFLYLNAF